VRMEPKRTETGFTLIEVMIVVVIIGVVASFAIPQYLIYIQTAEETACLVERGQANRAIIAFINDHQEAQFTSLSQLANTRFYEEAPNCPHGGEWLVVQPEHPSGTPTIACSLHFWPGEGTTGSGEGLMGSDDFEDGSGEWTETGSDWKVVDGTYIGGNEWGSSWGNRTFFGDEGWTDYTVELDANLMNGQGGGYGYGVYIRAQDYENLNAYVFQYDAGYGSNGAFLFRKIVDGNEQSPFARVDAPEGYDWNGEDKHITVEVSGNTFSAYVSDVNGGTSPAVQGTDSSYSEGAIGLRTWGSAQAGFDNIQVSEQ